MGTLGHCQVQGMNTWSGTLRKALAPRLGLDLPREHILCFLCQLGRGGLRRQGPCAEQRGLSLAEGTGPYGPAVATLRPSCQNNLQCFHGDCPRSGGEKDTHHGHSSGVREKRWTIGGPRKWEDPRQELGEKRERKRVRERPRDIGDKRSGERPRNDVSACVCVCLSETHTQRRKGEGTGGDRRGRGGRRMQRRQDRTTGL